MSRLFSPSAPSVGLEAWGLGPSGQACGTEKGNVEFGRQFLRGAEEVGGEAGRLWQVAEEAEGGRGAPLPLPGASWRVSTCLLLTVVFQDLLHLVLHGGLVGDPGALGVQVAAVPAAACLFPLAPGGQHVLLNLAGHLIWFRCSRPEMVHFQSIPRSAGPRATLSREVLENFATVTAAQTRVILLDSPRGVRASVCSSIVRCFHLCSLTNILELTLGSRAEA